MATVDMNSVFRSLSQRKWDQIYFVIGEERYFSDRLLSQFRSLITGESLREFNESLFYGSELDGPTFIDTLQTLPVMSDYRLVILKEAHLVNEKVWAMLSDLRRESFQSTVLVCQGHSLDRRKKSIKNLVESSTLVECQTPTEAARAPWIRTLAKEKELDLDSEALAFMVQMGGNSLEEIERDLEQVSLFYGEKRRLNAADLGAVLERHREESIFSLAEAVGKKDRTQALYSYQRLQSQGENEVAIVALLARHLRLLLKVKWGRQQGLKGPSLAQKVGVNNYFLPQYLNQSELWPFEALKEALIDLAAMDREIKSSSIDGSIWIQKFLLTPR